MTRLGSSLQARVAIRSLLVGAFCLAAATVWVVRDTANELRRDAELSAERVAQLMGSTGYVGLISLSVGGVSPTPVFFDWQDYPAAYLIAPGVCVEFGQTEKTMRRRCGAWDPETPAPPSWFASAFETLLETAPPERDVIYRGEIYAHVEAHLDLAAAQGRAWSRVRVLFGVALMMTVAMGVLTALVIARTLAPFRQIARGLRALEMGDFALRLPGFRAREFAQLSTAFNDMSDSLERGRSERRALTRRLFEVQETERRQIARELHDEFGQCLTATRALAASIEARAKGRQDDLAEDARAISGISGGMMETLRSALFLLRPPELDDLGLEQALRRLVNGWSARKPETAITLAVHGDCAEVGDDAALSLYRIAQECLTNAMRHGKPSRVSVDLDAAAGGAVSLSVTDDGGGLRERAPVPEPGQEGFGLLGIRERVAALGGTLEIDATEDGVRVVVALPRAERAVAAVEPSRRREIFPAVGGNASLAATLPRT